AITGYDEDDLRGRRLGDIFAPEDAPRAQDLRSGFTQGRFPQGVDLKVLRKDDKIITVSVNFNSVLREEGAVLCSFRDVTQERAVEGELVKTKDFLQRVIDSSVDAIISADMKGRVLLFNRAAERVYAKPSAEMMGSDVRKLYPGNTAREIMKLIRAGGGRVEGLRTEILSATGEHVPVSLSAALIHEGDTPVGSV